MTPEARRLELGFERSDPVSQRLGPQQIRKCANPACVLYFHDTTKTIAGFGAAWPLAATARKLPVFAGATKPDSNAEKTELRR